MNSLQEIELIELEELFEGSPEEVIEKQNRFVVTDLHTLNWVLRKLQALQTDDREIASLAQAERDRIDKWEKSQREKLAYRMQVLEQKAIDFHVQQRINDPKKTSISTPYGKLISRKTSAQIAKVDEVALMKYAKTNGQYVKVEEKLEWGALKKALKISNGRVIDENGEIVPGVTIQSESISFKVEVNE